MEPAEEPMSTPLYRSRPGGFDIRPASMPEARAVADSVYVSEGLSNSYLVKTSDGCVVINTGMGFEAPVHKRNYDALDAGPVRYILLTQGHVDHVGGVDLIRGEGTRVVAQAGNAAHQADDDRIARFRAQRSAFAFADAIARSLRYIRQNLGGELPGQSRPTPDLTFEDRLELEVGGVRFELLATPGGETTDSMVVWLPERRICFAGNLFSALFGHFPNLVTIRGDRYRDALRFVGSLDRVLGLEPELLLVGHHGPVAGAELVRSELRRLRGAVLHVHDETVRGMNEGRDVETLMREIRLPPELEVGEGYGKVSWSVRAIWENYAGWFHHRSTTELYPTPARAVYPDLVELAGGPDPVAKRAQARLDAGEPLEAIHLAEVALAADPGHADAIEACLAAHEALEAESENFWLSSWLRREIARLRPRRRDEGGPEA
jgi:alkyl sulfatase BDS1-like metallo-beta-lactamase superfamily hydrolase